MAEQVRKDVAVFIDFENIYVSVRDKLDTNPNFEIIMDRCNELGRVILARAYADWYRYPRITSALYANNIEPMYVPTYYYDKDAGRTGRPIKNSVDMNLCIEAMRTLFTMPGLSTFVLITGDRDFIPLVNSIRQQGKDVIIIGVGGAASSHLAQSADEFIFYEHLIGKQIAVAPSTAASRRYSEIDEFERPVRDRPAPVVQRAGRAEIVKVDKPERKEKETTGLTEDAIWEMLAKAVVEARARSIVPSVGSLKTLVRELSNGEFRESMVRDANGRPFERFRDVVQEAAKRGKLIISTDSIVNEIFLPGEDPRTLSSFNVPIEKPPERAEEPLPSLQVSSSEAQSVVIQPSNDKSRRRRRNDRDSKRTQPFTMPQVLTDDVSEPVADEYAIVPAEPVLATHMDESTAVDTPTQVGGVPFSDEERQMVRDIVAKSERALSFQQIYDALRSTRNRGGEQHIPRTNEELRSLVKSIINAGELQRIGRGNRVSYRMAQKGLKADVNGLFDEPVTPVDELVPDAMMTIAEAVVEDAQVVATPEYASTALVMVPTPDDLADADDGLSLPPFTPSKANVTNTDTTTTKSASATKPKKSAKSSSTTSRAAKQPTQNAKQPTQNAKQPTQNAKQPTQNAKQPTQNAKQPTQNAKQPTQNAKTASKQDKPTTALPTKAPSKRESKSSGTNQRGAKTKSAQASDTSTAIASKPIVQSVPSPVDAPASAPKPRRRKQTPES